MTTTTRSDIASRLIELAAAYPQPLQAAQQTDVARLSFHLQLLLRRVSAGRVADIGGGVGLFSLGAQALGLSATLVDDFRDAVNTQHGDAALEQHRKLGVDVVSRDVIADGVEFEPASLDAVTSFDSMEHWHHSPRKLFAQLMQALKPGGWFILGVPNAVNMRKRLTVPFGRGKWSSMQEWYDEPVFRGHVREPDVRDLRYIARDLKLAEVRIFGRNWQGRMSPNGLVRAMTAVFDLPLRMRAGWCSDIYMLGRKPGT
ncbi:MAG: methyltransferase domain-containing protein [Planctomycetes bacterium]|nr:methyltransferase domain-containing protein [Planctomycetota bacterium]